MEELVRFIARSLVEHSDDVIVTSKEQDGSTVIELHVHEEDMGRVIGKQGRIAKAIRTVVHAAAVKSGKKYTVDIV
ncbi:MAG: KH domain-containing protein [Clostridia bacterium]